MPDDDLISAADLGLGGGGGGSPTPSPTPASPGGGSAAPVTGTPAPDPLATPPASWPKEMHEFWPKTDTKVREYWAKREKEMTDGFEAYKGRAQVGESLGKVVDPYRAYIQSRGATIEQAINYLLNADYTLQTANPEQRAAFFSKLAKQYGIDLTKLPDEKTWSDPQLKPIMDKFGALETQVTGWIGQQQQQMLDSVQRQIAAFGADPKHPYFDEVTPDITRLVNAGYSLEDAYERAVWANPATRTKEIARLEKEKAEADRLAAEKKAADALRAKGGNVRPSGSTRQPQAGDKKWEEALGDTLAEINSRTS